MIKDGAAILSQHQGDLDDLATFEDFQKNLRLYQKMYDHHPELCAADRHPGYRSTKFAIAHAEQSGVPLRHVQHHHAHIASCLVENGVPIDSAPVLGIVLDGLGFGDDGAMWGGEFLMADYTDYRRVAHFKPVRMLGGDKAGREPWRNTFAHIDAAIGWEQFVHRYSGLELCEFLQSKPVDAFQRMTRTGLNSPLTSSCGRLFDAVAAAVGICRDEARFEGQPAMELESLVIPLGIDVVAKPYDFGTTETGDAIIMDSAAMWAELLADLAQHRPSDFIATRFHRGLAQAIHRVAMKVLAGQRDAEQATTQVALSGGCFQNRHLLESLTQSLANDGFEVLTHSKVPSNDGGVSLGQAAIAAARQLEVQD